MKIAVSSVDADVKSAVDPRFGRAKYFMVYDNESCQWETIGNQQNLEAAQGAGIQSAAHIVNAGCSVLISGHCGPKAFTALDRAGVAVYTIDNGMVEEVIERYKNGALTRITAADVDGHW